MREYLIIYAHMITRRKYCTLGAFDCTLGAFDCTLGAFEGLQAIVYAGCSLLKTINNLKKTRARKRPVDNSELAKHLNGQLLSRN